MVEAKAGRTVQSSIAGPRLTLKKAANKESDRVSRAIVVPRKAPNQPSMTAVAPGVEAVPVEDFSKILNA